MKTFLINLDKNPDRLAFMDDRLKRLNIGYERIPAVYGKSLSLEERHKQFRKFRSFFAIGRKLSDGEIGCALSHLSVYRKMIAAEIPVALILEDDVAVDAGIIDVCSFLEKTLDPSRKQVAVLSAWNAESVNDGKPSLNRIGSFGCTDGYVITLAAAKEVIKLNYPVITVADSWRRWGHRGGLELFRAYPTTIAQDIVRFPTDISQNAMKAPHGFKFVCWKAFRVPEKLCDWLAWKLTGR